MPKKRKEQEPFEPTVGLTQVGVLHGELPGEFEKDQIIAHLRQENAELKDEVVEFRKLLEESIELLNEVVAFGNCDCDIPNCKTCIPCECAMHIKRVKEHLNPQLTQDAATAIAYGLYPSSARPVNPGGEPKCTCPSVACQVHGLPPGSACGGW